jgi:hypothetical protein
VKAQRWKLRFWATKSWTTDYLAVLKLYQR